MELCRKTLAVIVLSFFAGLPLPSLAWEPVGAADGDCDTRSLDPSGKCVGHGGAICSLMKAQCVGCAKKGLGYEEFKCDIDGCTAACADATCQSGQKNSKISPMGCIRQNCGGS